MARAGLIFLLPLAFGFSDLAAQSRSHRPYNRKPWDHSLLASPALNRDRSSPTASPDAALPPCSLLVSSWTGTDLVPTVPAYKLPHRSMPLDSFWHPHWPGLSLQPPAFYACNLPLPSPVAGHRSYSCQGPCILPGIASSRLLHLPAECSFRGILPTSLSPSMAPPALLCLWLHSAQTPTPAHLLASSTPMDSRSKLAPCPMLSQSLTRLPPTAHDFSTAGCAVPSFPYPAHTAFFLTHWSPAQAITSLGMADTPLGAGPRAPPTGPGKPTPTPTSNLSLKQ